MTLDIVACQCSGVVHNDVSDNRGGSVTRNAWCKYSKTHCET